MSPPDAAGHASKELRSDHQHEEPPAEADHEEGAAHAKSGATATAAGDAAVKRMAKGGKPAKPAPPGPKGKTGDQTSVDLSDSNKVTAFLASATGATVDHLKPAERAAIAATPPSKLDDAAKAGLKLVFDHTPDSELDTLKRLIGDRYRIDAVGKDKGKGNPDWDADGLRRTWAVLEQLPPAHVEGNEKIYALTRYKTDKKTAAEGYYLDSDGGKDVNNVAMAYTPGKEDSVDNQGEFSDKQDGLFGLNIFNGTVRHEIGHAVDAEGKFSDRWCIGNAAGGNWKSYDDKYAACLADLIAASGGGIGASSKKDDIIAELSKILKQQKFDKIEQLLEAAPFFGKLPAAEQKQVLADPALKVIAKNTTANEPWSDASGGLAIGGRIFQESYDQSWVSYDVGARDRKVSKYQFRAPGEWFAEAYAAYYEPPTKQAPKGALLEKNDPKTKAFFDKNVDTMKASKGDSKDTKKPKASP